MPDAVPEKASHGDVERGFSHFDALLQVAGQLPTTSARVRRGGPGHPDIDHANARAGFAAGPFAVHPQGDVVDRLEQHQPHEAPKQPLDHLQGWGVLRQERRDPLQFVVGKTGRITPDLPLDRGHAVIAGNGLRRRVDLRAFQFQDAEEETP